MTLSDPQTPETDKPQPEKPESEKPSRLKRVGAACARFFGSGISVLILVLAVSPLLVMGALYAPGPLSENKTVVIAHGTTAADIARKLAEEKAVHASLLFRVAARIEGSLKAGEYAIPASASSMDIAKMMHEGRSVVRLFTVAEGLTSAEVARLLTNDPVMTGDLAAPTEGSLLPETYRYTYGDSRAGMIVRMQKAMQEKVNALWEAREKDLPLRSVEEAVVLASIIEKETGKAGERPRVAGVFYNRLRRGMRLQSDPTVIYALTKGQKVLDRPLSHEDLGYASPYNTYASDGLPPKPICNPGLASLEAALHPENHNFFYFVANGGDGGHSFAADLPKHNENVVQWHKTKKKTETKKTKTRRKK